MKIFTVLPETLYPVPLRVNADKEPLHPRPFIFTERLQSKTDHTEIGGADIRTPGVAEVDQYDLGAKIAQAYRSLVGLKREFSSHKQGYRFYFPK